MKVENKRSQHVRSWLLMLLPIAAFLLIYNSSILKYIKLVFIMHVNPDKGILYSTQKSATNC